MLGVEVGYKVPLIFVVVKRKATDGYRRLIRNFLEENFFANLPDKQACKCFVWVPTGHPIVNQK